MPQPSKLAKIKTISQAIAAKKSQLAAAELETRSLMTTRHLLHQAVRNELDVLQGEMNTELGSITDIESAGNVAAQANVK